MKKELLCVLFILSFPLCTAQNEKREVDSLAIISRIKADRILQQFETSNALKLIFSIENKNYYMVIKEGCNYKEYYIATDSSGNIKEKRRLATSKKSKKILSKAFELDGYAKNLTTNIPKASYVRGKPSYFVVKDEEGNRYGEYRLPVFSLPPPINKKVYSYLVGQLSKETKAP